MQFEALIYEKTRNPDQLDPSEQVATREEIDSVIDLVGLYFVTRCLDCGRPNEEHWIGGPYTICPSGPPDPCNLRL